jgi:hypothetical protein
MINFLKVIFENQYSRETIIALVCALIGFILSKLTSKMAVVTYNVSTSKLGETANNNIHGKIEVRHRDQVLPNFYFSNIIIHNSSTQDLENIPILFFVGDGILILSDFIRYTNAVKTIPYSSDYDEISKNPNNNLFFSRREYLIPVLNRGQSINVELTLTHLPNISFPYIRASMVHKGSKLVERRNVMEFHGVPMNRTLPWGIAFGIVLYVAISLFGLNPWISGLILLLYGFFAQSIAALALKMNDKIFRGLGIMPPIQ